jgi:DNA-binding PadR family transcriptional regulator
MADPASLGEFEQLVLLGVLQSSEDAYGVPVWRAIETRAARKASLAAVYKTLDRLEAKGAVRSHVGEPTAERGGRAKRIYQVTPLGLRALRASLAAVRRMSAGLDGVLGT